MKFEVNEVWSRKVLIGLNALSIALIVGAAQFGPLNEIVFGHAVFLLIASVLISATALIDLAASVYFLRRRITLSALFFSLAFCSLLLLLEPFGLSIESWTYETSPYVWSKRTLAWGYFYSGMDMVGSVSAGLEDRYVVRSQGVGSSYLQLSCAILLMHDRMRKYSLPNASLSDIGNIESRGERLPADNSGEMPLTDIGSVIELFPSYAMAHICFT
jgi:hypothetical protein